MTNKQWKAMIIIVIDLLKKSTKKEAIRLLESLIK